MKNKKLLCVLCALVLLLFSVSASAANIGGNTVKCISGKEIAVPVSVENNKGLMGFRISVKYDADLLLPLYVSRGTVTEKGMFEDNIDVSENGEFDVIWNYTEEIDSDGTLFTVLFESKKEKNSEIIFDYNQKDTFDGNYKDVSLTLENTKLVYDNGLSDKVVPEKKNIDSEDVKIAVETALKDFGVTAIDEISQNESQNFITKINDVINAVSGEKDKYNSTEEVKKGYSEAVKDVFVQTILESTDTKIITDSVQKALNDVKASSTDKIPKEKQPEFVEKFIEYIQPYGGKTILENNISAEDAVNAIETLNTLNEEQKLQNESIKQQQKAKPSVTIIAVIGISILILTAIILIIKYKAKSGRNITEESSNEK